MRKSTHVKTTRKVITEKITEPTKLFKLTIKYQHSLKGKDGKKRNYYLFFLNDVLILKQKSPFDETMEHGYPKLYLQNVYLFKGSIHQERVMIFDQIPRSVKYPVSKARLQALNVPSDLKIELIE